MSFQIEIHAGERNFATQIPPYALSGLNNLEKRGYVQDVHQLVVNVDGEERSVGREALLQAIDRLSQPAKSMGSGFRVRRCLSFGDHRETSGPGIGGALIDGIFFGIRCFDDHWYMKPSGTNWPATLPLEMRGLHRYEPAEIQPENMGIIRIERKKGPRLELAELIQEIAEFLASVPDEFVTVVVG